MIYSLDGKFYIDIGKITAISDIYEGARSIMPGQSRYLFNPYFLVYCELQPEPVRIHSGRGVLERWRYNLVVKWQKFKAESPKE